MSDQPQAGSSSGDELQFDQVEAQGEPAAGPSCAACRNPIVDAYYMVNQGIVCAGCRDAVGAALAGGSRIKRVCKGSAYGVGGGAVGAGIYFAVLALTGYEVGLIAIIVGVLVGVGVRAGSDARGGWFYQLLAMFITYCAIVSTYVPMFAKELQEDFVAHAKRDAATQAAPTTSAAVSTGEKESSAGADPATSTTDRIPIIGKVIIYAISFVVAFLSPILAFDGLGYVIKGIALYEAWKINKRLRIDITGPFQLAPAAVGVPIAGIDATTQEGTQEEDGRA